MKMTGETKFFLGTIAVTILLIAAAVFFLTRPAPPPVALARESLVPQGTNTTGNASASAYLVEFSDFQCPACKGVKPIVEDIIKTYGDKLSVSYRHFPLSQHPYGMSAAIAAEAAGRQGKFWEMGDLLFSDQENLSDALVSGYADQLKLDKAQFDKDLKDPALKDKVTKDSDYGVSIGINSTPTFFLNGIKLNLPSYADLKQKVADLVK